MIGNDGLPSPVWGSQVTLGDNLGLIPSWQFQQGPSNPLLNMGVKFPEGMHQSTVQPMGAYYSGPMLSGLGFEPLDTVNAVFDSWWWRNRKWVVLGAVGALAIGIFGGITAILK
jgi:hypothetical protein